MKSETLSRLYRAAWYAAAGWCVIACGQVIADRFAYKNTEIGLFFVRNVYSPETSLSLYSVLFAITAGPLVLLTVGHWVTTGRWRFGWKG
jgi:hypothetical protein